MVQPIPRIQGRPWLMLAQAKEDWGKGTLTLGRGHEKIVLPLFPTHYQGETQDDGTKFSSDESETNGEISSEPINQIKGHQELLVKCNVGKEIKFPNPSGIIFKLEHIAKSNVIKEGNFPNASGDVVKLERSYNVNVLNP